MYHPNSYNHYGTIDDYGNAEHGFSFVSPFAGYGYFGRRRSDFYHEPAPHYAQPRDEIAELIWIMDPLKCDQPDQIRIALNSTSPPGPASPTDLATPTFDPPQPASTSSTFDVAETAELVMHNYLSSDVAKNTKIFITHTHPCSSRPSFPRKSLHSSLRYAGGHFSCSVSCSLMSLIEKYRLF